MIVFTFSIYIVPSHCLLLPRLNAPSSNKETSAVRASVVEDYLLIYLKDSALSWEVFFLFCFFCGAEHPVPLLFMSLNPFPSKNK